MSWDTAEHLAAAELDERQVRDALAEHGWTAVYVGARSWPEAARAVIRVDAIWPLRTMPDILATHPEHGARLVEVIRSGGAGFAHIPVELAKLVGLDQWARIIPVVVVDVSTLTMWQHIPVSWCREVIAPLQRPGDGSRKAFALLPRSGRPAFDGRSLP